MDHEIGHAPPRGMPLVPGEAAEALLSELTGKPVALGDDPIVTEGPDTCPACGSTQIRTAVAAFGGWDAEGKVHPLLWGVGHGICDSYVCNACDAGWQEGWKPHPITWVRPWRSD